MPVIRIRFRKVIAAEYRQAAEYYCWVVADYKQRQCEAGTGADVAHFKHSVLEPARQDRARLRRLLSEGQDINMTARIGANREAEL